MWPVFHECFLLSFNFQYCSNHRFVWSSLFVKFKCRSFLVASFSCSEVMSQTLFINPVTNKLCHLNFRLWPGLLINITLLMKASFSCCKVTWPLTEQNYVKNLLRAVSCKWQAKQPVYGSYKGFSTPASFPCWPPQVKISNLDNSHLSRLQSCHQNFYWLLYPNEHS